MYMWPFRREAKLQQMARRREARRPVWMTLVGTLLAVLVIAGVAWAIAALV